MILEEQILREILNCLTFKCQNYQFDRTDWPITGSISIREVGRYRPKCYISISFNTILILIMSDGFAIKDSKRFYLDDPELIIKLQDFLNNNDLPNTKLGHI